MSEPGSPPGGSFDRYLANRAPLLLWSTPAARASATNRAVGIGLCGLSAALMLVGVATTGPVGFAFGIGPPLAGWQISLSQLLLADAVSEARESLIDVRAPIGSLEPRYSLTLGGRSRGGTWTATFSTVRAGRSRRAEPERRRSEEAIAGPVRTTRIIGMAPGK